MLFRSETLSADEVAKLLQASNGGDARSLRDRALLELFYSSGLRVSELAGLTLQQLDPVEGFVRVPLNDIEALRAHSANKNITAVFLETIQGEGGITPARWDYLREVRALCDANGWLLMLDEVQCGIGRTGKWFAHQWAGDRKSTRLNSSH